MQQLGIEPMTTCMQANISESRPYWHDKNEKFIENN